MYILNYPSFYYLLLFLLFLLLLFSAKFTRWFVHFCIIAHNCGGNNWAGIALTCGDRQSSRHSLLLSKWTNKWMNECVEWLAERAILWVCHYFSVNWHLCIFVMECAAWACVSACLCAYLPWAKSSQAE